MSRIEVELFNAGTSEYIGPIEREVGDKLDISWRPLEIVASVLNFGIGC